MDIKNNRHAFFRTLTIPEKVPNFYEKFIPPSLKPHLSGTPSFMVQQIDE